MPGSTRPSAVALIGARYELVRELRGDRDTLEWEGFDSALGRSVIVQLLRPELTHEPATIERFWQTARAAARRPGTGGDRVLDAGTDPGTGQLFLVREWPGSPADPQGLVPPGPAPTARKPGRSNKRSRWLALASLAVLVLLVAAVIRPGLESWLSWVNAPLGRSGQGLGLTPAVAVPASGAQPGQSTSTPAAAPPTVAAAAPATPSRTPSGTATAVSTGQTRRIVNTDGLGVALRAAAGGDRLPGKGYDEGATVQTFEQSGQWTRIRGSDGREGWVLSVTLAP